MPLFRTRSGAIYGVDAVLIDVEVDLHGGPPQSQTTVGLPGAAVRESRERIKGALVNSGFGYANKALTINLAPADLRKEGPGFDLPIAVGILGTMDLVSKNAEEFLIAGELSLDGSVRPIRGALSLAACAAEHNLQHVILPANNAAEAAVVSGVAVYGVRALREALEVLGALRPAPST